MKYIKMYSLTHLVKSKGNSQLQETTSSFANPLHSLQPKCLEEFGGKTCLIHISY